MVSSSFFLPPHLLLLFPSPPQAQNTQQTGFKGNLRLLVKTLEQPHLPFKILPAALSHCLHSSGRLMLATSTAFPFFALHGSWAREDTVPRLYKSFSYLFMLEGTTLHEYLENELASVYAGVCAWSMCGHVAGRFGVQRGFISHNWFSYTAELHLSITPPPLSIWVLLPSHFLSLCGTVRLPRSQIQRLFLSLPIFFPTQRSKSLCLHLLPPYCSLSLHSVYNQILRCL